jgi:hypothetical protein
VFLGLTLNKQSLSQTVIQILAVKTNQKEATEPPVKNVILPGAVTVREL